MRLSLPGLQTTALGGVGLSTLRTLAVNPQSRELVGVGVRNGLTSLYRVSADSGKAVRLRILAGSDFAGSPSAAETPCMVQRDQARSTASIRRPVSARGSARR